MKKVLAILNIVSKVMTTLVTTVIAVISLATAYIVFAPDEFPKPFRLMYSDSGAPLLGGHGATVAAASQPTVEPTPEPLKPGQGVMFNMSTKIINLADPSGRKYIRLTIVLEFAPPKEATTAKSSGSGHGAEAASATDDFAAQINARMPIMDDAVITLLSTKSFDELYTAEGKERLRQELMQAIAERVPEYSLISIYFTEFVVQ